MNNFIIKINRFLVLATLFLIVQGCASLGPVYQAESVAVPSDKSLVYIYRPNKFTGSGITYYVYADEKIATKLYNGGYFPYISEPGNVKFWAKTESKSSVQLELKPGNTYYLKGGVQMGVMVGRPNLERIPENVALSEIEQSKLIPDKDWAKEKIENEKKRKKLLGL